MERGGATIQAASHDYLWAVLEGVRRVLGRAWARGYFQVFQ
ncbi:MAG: hypothetical protein NZ742_10250 [Acidobacteria bacterium]|nr:hypothetical protein [Acidobacteriota bacterium]MDW7985117.1 hypothetical protein [Acidobacteriota bacterium]